MNDALQTRHTTVEVLLAVLVAAVVALGVVLDGRKYVVVFGLVLAVVTVVGIVLSASDA